ncbi:MAG: hypothetical protein AB7S44_03405 [Spirochaetales bacterium]
MEKMTKNCQLLLSISALTAIIAIFTDTFLVAHIISISVDTVSNVAIYFLIMYGSLALFYQLFSPIIKKFNKLTFFKLGIFIRIPAVILLILFSDKLLDYYWMVAILLGASEGIYWVSYNSIRNELVASAKAKSFFVATSILKRIVTIFLPILFGLSIDFLSFEITCIILLVIISLEFIVSLFIKYEPIFSSHTYSLKKYFGAIRSNVKLFTPIFFDQYLNGFLQITTTLITYFILLAYGTNTSLGIFGSIIGALSVLVSIWYLRKYSYKKSIFIWLAAITGISMLVIVFNFSVLTIIIFNLVYQLANTFTITIRSVQINNTIRSVKLHEYIVENMAITDLAIELGRILGYGVLLAVSLVSSPIFLQILIGVCSIIMALQILVTGRLEKNFAEASVNNAK